MNFNLKQHRLDLGISQTELAKLSGVTSAAISLLENNNRVPNLKTAAKLSQALGITIDELAGVAKQSSDKELRAEVIRLRSIVKQVSTLSAV